MLNPLKVFISYSHADDLWREKLGKHLRLLEHQDLIKVWHDRCVTAGAHWAHTMEEKLRAADVILLLVSADFIASDYCYGIEMEVALEQDQSGRSRVVPILLRKCDWKSAPFAKCQVVPRDNIPIAMHAHGEDAALAEIAAELRALAQELRSSTAGDKQTVLTTRARRASSQHRTSAIPDAGATALDPLRLLATPALDALSLLWRHHQYKLVAIGAGALAAGIALGILQESRAVGSRGEARPPTQASAIPSSTQSPPPSVERVATPRATRISTEKAGDEEDRPVPLHQLAPLQEVALHRFVAKLYWCDARGQEIICTFALSADERYSGGGGTEPNRVTAYTKPSRALDHDGGEYLAQRVELGNDSGVSWAAADLAPSIVIRGSIALEGRTPPSGRVQLLAINIQGPGDFGNPLIYFRNVNLGDRRRLSDVRRD